MRSFMHRAAEIDWYCQAFGEGPKVVLIPSGEGDCSSFDKVGELLGREFSVLTFDMPGFSRTSRPPEFGKVTIREITDQVAALLQSLGHFPATVYGCSSGGQITLDLVARYPQLVRNALVHEVPLSDSPELLGMAALDDEGVANACEDIFRNVMNEAPEAWDELGEDYHARLKPNLVTWMRHYVHEDLLQHFTPADLQRRPLVWTVGGLSPIVAWFENIMTACHADIEIGLLMCRHFPQASMPDALAVHIAGHARRWLEAA